jgi:hypothetical protein
VKRQETEKTEVEIGSFAKCSGEHEKGVFRVVFGFEE